MMKKETIYLDTSVISAYNDKREPEKKLQTKEFLKNIENNKGVFVSTLVKDEIAQIKSSVRKKELGVLMDNYKMLVIKAEIEDLAEIYINNKIIPETHPEDALHLAIATVNNIDIVVSWNFTHLVKLKTRHLVKAVNVLNGYKEIEIIAPVEY